MKRNIIAALLLSASVGMPVTAIAATDAPGSGTAPGTRMGDKPPASGKQGSQSNPSGSADASFRSMDTNNDGFLSRDEVKGNSSFSRQFNEIDKDRDGRISPSEYSGRSTQGDAGTKGPRDSSAPGGGVDKPANPQAGSDASSKQSKD